jgi:hypothetical protein
VNPETRKGSAPKAILMAKTEEESGLWLSGSQSFLSLIFSPQYATISLLGQFITSNPDASDPSFFTDIEIEVGEFLSIFSIVH